MKIPWRTLKVTFAPGTTYEGVEVRMRLDRPLDAYIEMGNKRDADYLAGKARGLDGEASSSAWERNIAFVAALLIDWNIEDDAGAPLPATADSLRTLPPQFLSDLLDQWQAQQPEAKAV